jgi:hypothetical protein
MIWTTVFWTRIRLLKCLCIRSRSECYTVPADWQWDGRTVHCITGRRTDKVELLCLNLFIRHAVNNTKFYKLYWTQNICEPELRHNNRGREGGGQDAACAITSPSTPYHGWLTANIYICNGQRSSELSCEKDTEGQCEDLIVNQYQFLVDDKITRLTNSTACNK